MIFSALLCTGLIPIRQFTFQHKHQPDAVAPRLLDEADQYLRHAVQVTPAGVHRLPGLDISDFRHAGVQLFSQLFSSR